MQRLQMATDAAHKLHIQWPHRGWQVAIAGFLEPANELIDAGKIGEGLAEARRCIRRAYGPDEPMPLFRVVSEIRMVTTLDDLQACLEKETPDA